MWMNWGEGYFKDRALKVQSLRGLWITSLNILLKMFKLLRSLQIVQLVTRTLRAREGDDLTEVKQSIDSASGLNPTWNQSSFHSAILTRKSNYWLITQLICSTPSDREALLSLTTHSMTTVLFEGFFFFLVQGKVRRDGEKEHWRKTVGTFILKNASDWVTSPLCWTRAP